MGGCVGCHFGEAAPVSGFSTISKPEASYLVAYRCAVCGKLDIRYTLRIETVCPECGSAGMVQLEIGRASCRERVSSVV